jgi:hypothetical protein
MAGKRREGTVYTERDFPLGYRVFLEGGYVLPTELTATATLKDSITAEVTVAIAEGRAKARKIVVASEKPNGIGWTTLASIEVRNIVATAVLDSLMRATTGTGGSITLLPLGKPELSSDEVREIVQGAVGYRPDLDRFKAVSS